MKTSKSYFAWAMLLVTLSLMACHTKKLAETAVPNIDTATKPVAVEKKKSAVAPTEASAKAGGSIVVSKPVFVFNNIQFDFDSFTIRTNNYVMLDAIAANMRTNSAFHFSLDGYSSAEGTPEHNLTLSQQRALAVRIYLINSGVLESQLSAKGNGENNPIASNDTDAGKALNRRVEVKFVK